MCIFTQPPISIHLHKIQRPVDPAPDVAHIYIERKLPILQLKHLVILAFLPHQIHPRPDIRPGLEPQRQRIPGRRDAVRALVIRAIKGTVLGARCRVRAEGGVPGVAGVAVGAVRDGVQPAPVGVEDDGKVVGGAAAGVAGGDCERGMGFRGKGAGLLGEDGGGAEGERPGRERK